PIIRSPFKWATFFVKTPRKNVEPSHHPVVASGKTGIRKTFGGDNAYWKTKNDGKRNNTFHRQAARVLPNGSSPRTFSYLKGPRCASPIQNLVRCRDAFTCSFSC